MISDNDRFAPITNAVRQVDHHGGYTAAAGHSLYTARKYPEPWWNRTAFVCEPTGHLVGAFVLSRDGANYRSTSPFNLVASDDEWASPIMAEVGPDGNMWVLDWYNYIVQHNPTPNGFSKGKGNAYESSLRDKKHGRVYRVEYQGKEGSIDSEFESKIARSGLANADMTTLVKTLTHSNFLWRKTAQRLIVEKFASLSKDSSHAKDTPALMDALHALVKDQSTDEIGINSGAVHAIWTLAGLQKSDQKTEDVLVGALRHPSPAVRRAAIQVLPNDSSVLDNLLASDVLNDSDAQVKLAAILKISDAKEVSSSVLEKLVSMTDLCGDKVLLDAWTSAAAIHFNETLPRLLRAVPKTLDGNYLARISIVAEHFARSLPTTDSVAMLVNGGTNPDVQTSILTGLEKGWAKNHNVQLDSETQKTVIQKWLDSPISIDSKSRLLQVASVWGVQGISDAAKKLTSQFLDSIRADGLCRER